jgi:hypothetical protein
MQTKTTSKVIVYHDETKIHSLKGHVLLFIPPNLTIREEETLCGTFENEIEARKLIYDKIMEVRENHSALGHKFHFADISGKEWTVLNTAEKKLVDVGVDALRRKGAQKFNAPLCCKLAIIYYPSSSKLKSYYRGTRKERILEYDETLLRMLLKGAIHFLYDENNQVEILKIVTDGMPHHREISADRVLQRLLDGEHGQTSPLQTYAKISNNVEIISQSSDHRKHEFDSEEFINANMLQLADMLLGSVNHSCFEEAVTSSSIPPIGSEITNTKGIVAHSVKEILDKKRRRGSGFIYSSHYKSFTLSKAIPQNDGSWSFEEITAREIENYADINQLSLFNCATQRGS